MDEVTWFRDNFRRTIAYFGRNPDALALLKEIDHAPDLRAFRGLRDLGGSYAKVLRRRWAERDIDLGPMPDVFPMLAFAMLTALVWMPWEDDLPDSATVIDLLAELCAGGMTALSPKVVARLDPAPRAHPTDRSYPSRRRSPALMLAEEVLGNPGQVSTHSVLRVFGMPLAQRGDDRGVVGVVLETAFRGGRAY